MAYRPNTESGRVLDHLLGSVGEVCRVGDMSWYLMISYKVKPDAKMGCSEEVTWRYRCQKEPTGRPKSPLLPPIETSNIPTCKAPGAKAGFRHSLCDTHQREAAQFVTLRNINRGRNFRTYQVANGPIRNFQEHPLV